MRKSIQATLVLIALAHGLAASAAESMQQSMAGSEAVPIQNEYYGGVAGSDNSGNLGQRTGLDGTASNVPMYRQSNGNLTDVDANRRGLGVPGSYERHDVKMEVRTYQ